MSEELVKSTKKNIALKRGGIDFQNMDELSAFALSYAKSDAALKCYQDNPANAVVVVLCGFEIGLSPIVSLQNMYIVNNKPALYAVVANAIVMGSPKCEYVTIKYIGTEYDDDFGVQITSKRKNAKEENVSKFTVADAKLAGLWQSKDVWRKHPKRMLMARAIGFHHNDYFPDILKGIKTVEELQDYDDYVDPESPQGVMDAEIAKALREENENKIDAEILAENKEMKKETYTGVDVAKEGEDKTVVVKTEGGKIVADIEIAHNKKKEAGEKLLKELEDKQKIQRGIKADKMKKKHKIPEPAPQEETETEEEKLPEIQSDDVSSHNMKPDPTAFPIPPNPEDDGMDLFKTTKKEKE